MNRSLLSDDEVVGLLERTMHRVADAAPGLPVEEHRPSRLPVAAAAAVVALVGAGGVALLVERPSADPASTVLGSASPPVPAGASEPTDDTSVPTVDTTVPPEGTTEPTDDTAVPTIDTTVPPGTAPSGAAREGAAPGDGPRLPVGTVPAPFPSEVPLPDDVESVTPMEWDRLRVGWEFAGRVDPAAGTERCVRYAGSFDDTWASTPDTDESPAVEFAHHFFDDHWDVGIYCVDDGEFLVQVISLDNTTPAAPDPG